MFYFLNRILFDTIKFLTFMFVSIYRKCRSILSIQNKWRAHSASIGEASNPKPTARNSSISWWRWRYDWPQKPIQPIDGSKIPLNSLNYVHKLFRKYQMTSKKIKIIIKYTCLGRLLGRRPWYFTTLVHDATKKLQINSTKYL